MDYYPDDVPLSILFGTPDKNVARVSPRRPRRKIGSYSEEHQDDPHDHDFEEVVEDKSARVVEKKKPKTRGRPPNKKRNQKTRKEKADKTADHLDDDPKPEKKVTKRRGRPPKKIKQEAAPSDHDNHDNNPPEEIKPRRRGRRRKDASVTSESKEDPDKESESEIKVPNKRRWKKRSVEPAKESEDAAHEEEPAPLQVVPKKRRRKKTTTCRQNIPVTPSQNIKKDCETISSPIPSIPPDDTTSQKDTKVDTQEMLEHSPTQLPSIQQLYKSPLGLLGMLRADKFCRWNHEHGTNSSIVLKVLKSLCLGKLPHVVKEETPFPKPMKEIMTTSEGGGAPPPRFYGVVRFDDLENEFALECPQLQMMSLGEKMTLPVSMTARGQKILLRVCLDEFVAGQLYVFVIRLLYGKGAVDAIHEQCELSKDHVKDILQSYGVKNIEKGVHPTGMK